MPVDVDRVRMHQHEIALLDDTTQTAELLLQIGWGIALDARADAPHRTGRGAASIQPWPGRDGLGLHVDVSWDRDHFYMGFHEGGTRYHHAQPFLGPALDRYIHL
ncbi:HK97-gp10 family putative phage morphogenesis protein [Micromonospora sp. WMMD723]|uniref:HK97-gp10 family putative phage morphogenesis protein n=1 Tax=Micromonospora sp. WMMD723 TaxID=3403465 RepID=UPI003CF24894